MKLRLVEENLVRQNKATMLLLLLLEEEFSRLGQLKPQSVSQIELSIQELMRQIVVERYSLRGLVGDSAPSAQKVADLYPLMDESMAENCRGLVKRLDETEQKCAKQAAKNNEMALALFDQSKGLLDFMHDQIKPKNTTAYSRFGRFAQAPSDARLLSGRM
ncbi:flagellar protein FlgN [Pseudodesulfovibrio sp. JC047]|uniref:flagellar export chaperone FlgN n=1 Tax=Pseudodesulfovibrio sp. JC047 TaxID=2683199 RepID=UPI0013D6109F|nr:flagellar export chaperone FlgN [Pseudodesulfovibrio sp. JC047]NDV17837.1 flagellar protein FlgN [Pseudodesulfovibrio sp. JC047]